ncbi:hypothetical protein M9434_005217 [Picochlorum sp. BPE23]|nr:hypothetical protein M9434_005217 [Picochlorum sp. BPE23]KAI8101366.1 hypothetical protein M9435_001472 [Picochlorum sp. BPE23]
MRSLFQSTTSELTPEATAGFILGFVVVGFAIAVMSAYMVFLTGKVKLLNNQLYHLERHPKLQKTEADLE